MIYVLLRVLIGGILAFSGFTKLISPYQNFQAVIVSYEMVTADQAALLAQSLPWVELIVGVFLILGLWSRIALAAAMAMNLVFIGALGQAILRKLPIDDCGCFGEMIHLKPWQTIIMDLTTLFILVVLFKMSSRPLKGSLDRFFDPT